VGIINTMLVMVRRRTMEIATLKTFGLRGGQVASLFVYEAILLGIIGSIVGIVIGTLLGGFVNQFGEQFLQQELRWRFYPESAIYGFALGLSVTVVFGVLPVLTATKVRPAIVLRPNETHIPVAGILQSIGVLFIVIIAIGVMVGSIFGGEITQRVWGDYLLGLGGTAGALAVIGIFILILWVVVWLVSRLPAFGNVDLKLALRNMTSRRWRTSTTLLALLAGMYALSSITFISQSVRDVIAFNFTNRLGGNVLVFPLTTVFVSPDLAEPFINQRIDGLEGVQSRTRNDVYTLDIEEINGEAIEFETFTFTDGTGEEQTFTDSTVGAIAQRTTNPNLERGELVAGRQLTPEDDGAARIVLNSAAIAEGAVVPEIGDILTVETNGRDRVRYEVEVVGLLAASDGPEADAFVPIGFIEQRPDVSFTTVQVDDANLDNVLIELSSLPTVFVLDISYIDNLIQQLIGQFSAIPTVVGLLALLAAAAIMANTVLLATLERRKQIGVMKAMGLKGRRVLGVLLLENTIIALLGAGIGIGLSALNSSLLSFIGIGNVVPIPPNALPYAIGLVFAAVLIAWVATIASARVITRESVTTVLRYD
ncbi:MAG: FtsX-like permease family protein, partial [Chloroflexota bacterium]